MIESLLQKKILKVVTRPNGLDTFDLGTILYEMADRIEDLEAQVVTLTVKRESGRLAL